MSFRIIITILILLSSKLKSQDLFKIQRNFSELITENNLYNTPTIKQYGFKLGLGYERLFNFSRPDVYWGINVNLSYNTIYAKINLNSNTSNLTREFLNKSIDFQIGGSMNKIFKIFKSYFTIIKLSSIFSYESPFYSAVKTNLNETIIDDRSQKGITFNSHQYSLRSLTSLEIDFPILISCRNKLFAGAGITFTKNIKTLLFENKPIAPIIRFSYNF